MEIKRKNSRKRQALLDALCATTEHPSAEMLYNTLKDDYPELSLGTVYRNLLILMDEGSIISVGKVGGQERYDARTEPHAHFVCQNCLRVIDLELSDQLSRMYSDIERSTGCKASSHSLSFSGICDCCKTQ